MAQTTPLPASDEIRRMMHLDWADGAVGGAPPLENVDRAARLYGVVADPYQDLAFGRSSLNDLMLISIYHLMENHQWSQAWRAIAKLHRMERDDAHQRERPRSTPVLGAADPATPAPPTTAPPVETASSSDVPPEPDLRSRPVFPTRELLALCAQRTGLSIADLERAAEVQPPFT